MAGSFGFDAAHYDVSMRMAELSLLPAVRAGAADTLIVADGTSCRHQIADGTRGPGARAAVHVACVLERALAVVSALTHRASRGAGFTQVSYPTLRSVSRSVHRCPRLAEIGGGSNW